MPITAVLTTGWPESSATPMSALQLHEAAGRSNKEYRKAIKELIASGAQPPEILCLEGIFRRSISGFGPLQKMVSTLLDVDMEIRCQIDAFAFAFLSGAKNYDTLLHVDHSSKQILQKQCAQWRDAVAALTEFERLGKEKPSKWSLSSSDWSHLKATYLALRSIVGRDSARDERRTLVVLLITGPASSDQIREDLRLNYSLSRRVMSALVDTGALSYRRESSEYLLDLKAISVVLFLVRELMGLDMLEMLDSIGAEQNG